MSNAIIWLFIYIPLIIIGFLLFLYLLYSFLTKYFYPWASNSYYKISYWLINGNKRPVKLIGFGFICLLIIIGIYLLIHFFLLIKITKKMESIYILKDYLIYFYVFIYLIILSIFITVILSPKKDLYMKIPIIIKDFSIVFFIIFIIAFLINLNNKLTIGIGINKKPN